MAISYYEACCKKEGRDISFKEQKQERDFPKIKMLFDYHKDNAKAPVRKVVQFPADTVGVG